MASSDDKRVRIRFPSSLKQCLFYLTDCNADRGIHTDHLLEIGDAPIRLLPFGGNGFLPANRVESADPYLRLGPHE